MLNRTQRALGQKLFQQVRQKYPEIQLASIAQCPENPSNVWVNITMPVNEDREIELGKMASELSTDILLEHGFFVAIHTVGLPEPLAIACKE